MRFFLPLLIVFALVAPAEAERPQRLSDRPAPTVKLVPSLGWRLSAVATTDVQDGVDVLMIEGDVFNAGGSERPSPKIHIAVQDGAGRDIYRWTVPTDQDRIKPGDYAPFRARLESPPRDMERVVVSVGQPGVHVD
jgi:hypothetical protein